MSEIIETEKNETEIKESENKETENKKTENTEAEKEKTENTEAENTEDLEEDNKESKKKKDKQKNKKNKKAKAEDRKPEDVNIVKDLLWLIVYIGIVILVCFLIIKFVGCRSRVDGSSMYPTLENGDNLWVDKLSYTFGDPKRFDIIIFNPGGNDQITYVKRIIGLPGETVSMDLDGNIYINNQLLKEDYALDEPFLPSSIGILSGDNEIVLGDDEYFVLGDNRNNSMDSRRSDPGNVKREYIVGKVVLRIYPFSKFGFVK